LNKPIKFNKQKKFISGRFPLNILQSKTKNIIKLAGIVYIISNNKKIANKAYLEKLADKYNMPVSGIIIYNKNKIIPLIYVKKTNSLVWENACGSGSLAYSLFSKYSEIKQPSGLYIEVKKTNKYFSIKSPVSIIK
ncbi:MAG: hypothetical protein WC894_06215, partial [Patescibacteria group bacterium]